MSNFTRKRTWLRFMLWMAVAFTCQYYREEASASQTIFRPGDIPSGLRAWWKLDEKPVHPMSAQGDVHLDTAVSRFGGASARFDGSGDFLTAPDNTAWHFAYGDVTIDFWVRFNTLPGVQALLFNQANSDDRYASLWWSNTQSSWQFNIIPSVAVVAPDSIAAGIWYHVALVRNGNVWTIYRDGVVKGSVTNSIEFPNYAGPLSIGSSTYNGYLGASHSFDGWMDEYRISKGVARWTSTFTPSVVPYLPDSDTVLLLHMDGTAGNSTFIDSSSHVGSNRMDSSGNGNNLSPSLKVGSIKDDHWATGEHSLDLDSAHASYNITHADYLSIDHTEQHGIDLPSSWSVACWFKAKALNQQMRLLHKQSVSMNDGYSVYLNSTHIGVVHAGTIAQIAHNLRPGRWYHLAVRCDSIAGRVQVFLDGNLAGDAAAIGTASNTSDPLYLGSLRGLSEFYDGQLKDVALWNRPLNSVEIKSLALGVDLQRDAVRPGQFEPSGWWKLNESVGRRLSSVTAGHPIEVVGTPRLSTGESRFGGSSLRINGLDYLRTPITESLDLGAEDFTIEYFLRFAGSVDGLTYAVFLNSGASDGSYVVAGRSHAVWYFALKVKNEGADAIRVNLQVNDPQPVVIDKWYHLAFVRQGSSWSLYRDGTRLATTTYSGPCPPFTGSLNIGTPNGFSPINIWLDELRISKGVARYSGDRAEIKDQPFSADPHTSVLLHFDGFEGSSNIIDSSSAYAFELKESIGAVRSTGGMTEAVSAAFDGSPPNTVKPYLKVSSNALPPELRTDDSSLSLSVSAWIKTRSIEEVNTTDGVIALAGVVPGFILAVNNPAETNPRQLKAQAYFKGVTQTPGHTVDTPLGSILPNTWHHIAAVCDSDKDEVRIYVDGILQGLTVSHSDGVALSGKDLIVGANGEVSGADFFQEVFQILQFGGVS